MILKHPKLPSLEPSWIKDITANPRGTQIAFDLNDPGKVAQLTEGELFHCEYCGNPYPLWPVSEWANHVMLAHRDALTVQAAQGIFQLCSTGLTAATQQFLNMQLVQRQSLRRRAHQLGLLVLCDAEGNPLDAHDPRVVSNPRIVQ